MHNQVRYKPRNRRIQSAALLLALLLFLTAHSAAVATAAPSNQSLVGIAISKDAYCYQPGGTVRFMLTFVNPSRQIMKGIDVRVRISPAVTSREGLDIGFEGKITRSYRQTETFGPLMLSPGNNKLDVDIQLKESRYSNGVYPVTVELIRSYEVISSANSQLLVMSSSEAQQPQAPLRLSLVFDTLDRPYRDVKGYFEGNQLAVKCSSSEKNPGLYPTLLKEMEKWKNMRFSVVLSPMLLEDMSVMSKGYILKKGNRARKVSADSPQSTDTAATLNGFRKLSQLPNCQLLPGPESSPDLEAMVYYEMAGDGREQLAHGRQILKELLDTDLSADYACPPGLSANSQVINRLGNDLGQNLVLSSRLLERSREGRRLLAGNTLGSPVSIDGGKDGKSSLALFADARMQELLERLSPSKDPHGVAQYILSELTNLYLERPGVQRTCAVVFPSSWQPLAAVLDEVLKAISSAPWLTTVTLAENMHSIEPVNETALKIPHPDADDFPSGYFQQVKKAEGKFNDYRRTVLPQNPNLARLQRDVYISESDVWRQWARPAKGLSYADYVISTVDNELGKVEMTSTGSVTVTSTKADIPISIVNSTGYRIRAVLKLTGEGLTFPTGESKKVLLEPKENLLEVPVKVRSQGPVRFSARLQVDNLTLGELSVNIITGRFNTFAILLVGGLLALIGAIWISRIISRRKVGKHKKRQLQEVGKARTEAEA